MSELKEQFTLMATELQEANHELQSKVAELKVVANYLKSILDHIVQGILFIDLDGTVTTYNNAAEKILEISKEQMLFQRYWQHCSDTFLGFSMKEALQQHPVEERYLTTYKTAHGKEKQLEIVVTSIRSSEEAKENPETPGLIVMISDVTEVYRLQLAAMRADRMKELGEIAAHVAHQIRNPLGGIKGFASLLKRDLHQQPELEQMAASIVEGTENLDLLVNQILQYARPVTVHLEQVPLKQLLVGLRSHILADSRLTKENIVIDIDVADDLVLSLDPVLFQSAVLNLLVNAIEAMPQGGGIAIVASKPSKQWIEISIADNGEGISEENRLRLFSPFFTTKPQGNGLGLTEVQKVVQAHGGAVEVMSQKGVGTTFILAFPQKNGSL